MAPSGRLSEPDGGGTLPGPSGGPRLRLAAGLSQEQLAARTGVSRQAVAGIEAGRFDPSLRVALDLAQALGRSVEDLFAGPTLRSPGPALLVGSGGPGPVPSEGTRVDLAEVGERDVAFALAGDQALRPGFLPASGHLLGAGPAAGSRGGEEGTSGGPEAGAPVLVQRGPRGQPAVVVAGCDPALGLLAGPLAGLAPPWRLAWWPCNSSAALSLAAEGLVHAAGVHHPEGGPGIRALVPAGLRRSGAEVVGFGKWEEGLAFRPELGEGGFDLAALAERGMRVVNREQGSEARQLLDDGLARAGLAEVELAGYRSEVRGHLLVASAVAAGLGDAGVTMAPAARAYGLGFEPLAREAFELVVPAATLQTPAVQALLRALSDPGLRLQLSRLPGYDATSCGEAGGSLP